MRRARAHLGPQRSFPDSSSSALEPRSCGACGRSLRPADLANPRPRPASPPRASGQFGAYYHEASVSTGPRNWGRRLPSPRQVPGRALGTKPCAARNHQAPHRNRPGGDGREDPSSSAGSSSPPPGDGRRAPRPGYTRPGRAGPTLGGAGGLGRDRRLLPFL